MTLDLEKWFKDILRLQETFNKSTDFVTKFAVLTAMQMEFETTAKWLQEEVERFKKLSSDVLLRK